jgi:hypothetical protein
MHDQGKDRSVLHAWLAGYAGEIASGRGLGRYDLIISEAGGHPYAEIVPQRRGWLARFRFRK